MHLGAEAKCTYILYNCRQSPTISLPQFEEATKGHETVYSS